MTKKERKIEIASGEDVSKYAPGSQASAPGAESSAGQGQEPGAATSDASRTGDEVVSGQGQSEETIDSLRAQVAEYKERLLRAQAECANISKRLHQQHAASLKLAGSGLARNLLPIVDSLERTLASMGESAVDDPVAQGIKLIGDQFAKVLRDYGVEPIEAVGKPFDPTLHEAMMEDRDSDLPPGTVTCEMQRGYRMHHRVLRPAKVAVSAAPADAKEAGEGREASSPKEGGAEAKAKPSGGDSMCQESDHANV